MQKHKKSAKYFLVKQIKRIKYLWYYYNTGVMNYLYTHCKTVLAIIIVTLNA